MESSASTFSPSSKVTIAVDIDEVLAYFTPRLIDFHNSTYGSSLELSHFVSYEFHNVWGGSKEECSDKINLFFDEGHCSHLDPIEGAYEVLLRLKARYSLQVVTARQFKIEASTREWIAKHFPDVFDAIHFGNHYSTSGITRSKAQICKEIGAQLLIDDSYVYASQCANEGIPVILFGNYPWNSGPERDISSNPGWSSGDRGGWLVRRVHSWSDIENEIESRLTSL